jgi:nitroreductase
MHFEEAISSRRRMSPLLEPAPSDAELRDVVELAMTAPDHGRLSPWRVISLRGVSREALGARFAEASDGDPIARERAAQKPLRAPLLLSLVFSPVTGHKIPEWEQFAAAVCAIHTMTLALHARGWGSIWRTGEMVDDPGVCELLALRKHERLLGWLYVGTPDADRTLAPRQLGRPEDKLTSLETTSN